MSDKLDRPYYAVLQGGYPAEQKHHIFPGSLYRKLCEKYSLWVPISAAVHDFAHCRGMQAIRMIQPMFDVKLNRGNVEEMMARRFCDIIGVNYDAALHALRNYSNIFTKDVAKLTLENMAEVAADNLKRLEK